MFHVNCFCVEGNYVGRMDTPPAQDQDRTNSGPRTYSHHTDDRETYSPRRMNESLTRSVENSHSGRAVLRGNWGGVGTASRASSLLNTLTHTHSQDQWLQRFIRGHTAKAQSVRVWSSHTDRAISRRCQEILPICSAATHQKKSFTVWASCTLQSCSTPFEAGPSQVSTHSQNEAEHGYTSRQTRWTQTADVCIPQCLPGSSHDTQRRERCWRWSCLAVHIWTFKLLRLSAWRLQWRFPLYEVCN